MRRVLAVASSGGHWVQLMRLMPSLQEHDAAFVTTNSSHRAEAEGRFYTVTDASSWEKLKLVRMFVEVACIVLRERPQIVMSTGAAPGLAALVVGRMIGARTLWLDSIANSEELSRSGKLATRIADVSLTQWEHLAKPGGPDYWGAVL